jgi:hypothetical protein
MFDAGSIASKLGLDVNDYAQGMLQAETIAHAFPPIVSAFLANPLLAVVEIAGEVGSALIEAFKSSQEQADKLNDMATNAGVAVEALSGLGLVAGQAGSGLETVADAYKFLGKNAAEVAQGNKSVASDFARIGVSATDAAGNVRPLEDIMFDVADAIAALPAGAARTNAAMSLLGRSGTEMIATLSQGGAEIRKQQEIFERYGAIVSRSAADSADAWGDAVGELSIAGTGIVNAIGEPLREALLPILQDLVGWVRENFPSIRSTIAEAATAAGRAVAGAAPLFFSLLDVMKEMASVALAVLVPALQASAAEIEIISKAIGPLVQLASASGLGVLAEVLGGGAGGRTPAPALSSAGVPRSSSTPFVNPDALFSPQVPSLTRLSPAADAASTSMAAVAPAATSLQEAMRQTADNTRDLHTPVDSFRDAIEGVVAAIASPFGSFVSGYGSGRGAASTTPTTVTVEAVHVHAVDPTETSNQIARDIAEKIAPVLAQRDREQRSSNNAQRISDAMGGNGG